MAKGKVLIAGAGIGGLTAAACLLKNGWDVEIYEQAPVLSEIGAGIQMSANAMQVLTHLGLRETILRIGVQPGAYVFRLHDTGEIIQTFSLADEHERLHGAPYVQLHRADLHDVLTAHVRSLKPDIIHLEHRVTAFTETADGVELTFANGQRAHGDLLVGADGIKSVIRAQSKGDVPAVYTGDAVWRILVPANQLPPNLFEQVMSVFMGPGGHTVVYYVRGGELLNFVGCVETEAAEESWTAKVPWDKLKAYYEGWHPSLQMVIDAADRDRCYEWSLYVRPAMRNWSTARTTLLGDSAHPTLPYLAQGAAMAIEDGAVLARALDQVGTIPEALQVYERARVDRTARVVEQSTANRRLFHLGTEAEIRKQFANRNEGADRNTWLYAYNPLTVPLS